MENFLNMFSSSSDAKKPASFDFLGKLFPDTKIANNMKEASDLIGMYNAHDLESMLKFITDANGNALANFGIDQKTVNMVKDFYKTNGPIALSGKNASVYKHFDDVATASFEEKRKQLLEGSQFLKDLGQSPVGKQLKDGIENDLTKIFANMKIMKVKENYLKYEYMFTQLWIIAFLNKINSSMNEFIDKTLELVRNNEEQRNASTRILLKTVLDVVLKGEEDIDENAFNAFRTTLEKTQQQMKQSANKFEQDFATQAEGLKTAIGSVNMSPVVGQQYSQSAKPAQPAQPGQPPSLYSSSSPSSQSSQPAYGSQGQGYGLRGGFLRDGVRPPQAFYDLETDS